MKNSILIALVVCMGNICTGQTTQKSHPITIGLEQDVLPYILGGYIITGWTGRDQFRYRFSYAKSNIPEFIHGDHTATDVVNAFGMSFEYFFKDNFEGLWFGPGIGYWTNTIETNYLRQIKNESVIFSFGGGYNYPITNWLYASPWVALHARVSGNETIELGNEFYKPTIFTPEVSLKLGIKIATK